jgi:tetratricopeptide (TPR) repeat protein
LFEHGYVEALDYIEEDFIDSEDEDTELTRSIRELKVNLPNNIALCALDLADWDLAIKHADMVLEIDQGNTKALYRRAKAYLHAGRVTDAKTDILKAIRLEPANKAFRTLL